MTHPLLRAAAVLAAIGPTALAAQPAERPLSTPDATFRDPFTTVSGVRELRDGRVLVADGRDGTLQLIDLRSGASTPAGRRGAGPGEWGAPTRLHAMPGDSTIMEDVPNGRFLLFTPDGRPGPTFRIAEGSPAASASLIGVDPRGNLIMSRERYGATEAAGTAGMVDLLRYDRTTGRTETIAQLVMPRGERSGARSLSGGMLQMFTNLPLAPRDAAAVHPDAGVAIVRATGYRVEWLRADGQRVPGPPGPAPRIRITSAEQEAFLRAQIRPGRIMVSGPFPGAASGGAAPVVPKMSATELRALTDPDMTWPAEKPPFQTNGVLAAPNARVWVLRSRAHDDPIPRYDVFDADGRVVQHVVLRANSRVVGFGRGSVFVARTDDDDLQHLERYRMP